VPTSKESQAPPGVLCRRNDGVGTGDCAAELALPGFWWTVSQRPAESDSGFGGWPRPAAWHRKPARGTPAAAGPATCAFPDGPRSTSRGGCTSQSRNLYRQASHIGSRRSPYGYRVGGRQSVAV